MQQVEDLPRDDDVVVELHPGAAAEGMPDPEPVDGLTVIGVPGAFAALEAHRALSAGSDVMLLTGDVPLADEVALKRRADAAGRLVLGPGSDTAIIDGIGIGIANQVAAGRLGVVATSGSGAQEAAVLLDRFGVGVSTCLVTGPRDLTDEVGATSTITALRRLADDTVTDGVVLVAEGFSARGAEAALAALAECGMPGSACLIGADGMTAPDGIEVHGVIDHAVVAAARRAGARPVIPAAEPTGWVSAGHVRGIFSGSALCAEAVGCLQHLLDATVAYTRTRVQFDRPIASNQVLRHRMVDMAIQCEESRAMALRAALAIDGDPAARQREVSGAKLKISRAARQVAEGAIQLHGAMGVTDELDVGAYAKRLMTIEKLCGTPAEHRDRLAGLRAARGA